MARYEYWLVDCDYLCGIIHVKSNSRGRKSIPDLEKYVKLGVVCTTKFRDTVSVVKKKNGYN